MCCVRLRNGEMWDIARWACFVCMCAFTVRTTNVLRRFVGGCDLCGIVCTYTAHKTRIFTLAQSYWRQRCQQRIILCWRTSTSCGAFDVFAHNWQENRTKDVINMYIGRVRSWVCILHIPLVIRIQGNAQNQWSCAVCIYNSYHIAVNMWFFALIAWR